MRRWSFTKGHGTQNDFVVLLDREAAWDLGPGEVRQICDRRAGIGADGVLRAVHAGRMPEWSGDPHLWFMDYRNADGSVSEMCGNGVRVFVRFLLDHDLAYGPTVPVATRAGLKVAQVCPDGRIRVSMGPASVGPATVEVRTGDGATRTGVAADVGNPHAVCFVDDLAGVPLAESPTWTPAEAFPAGVNVEFVRRLGPGHLAMRVHERGVGETRSCGTGAVAVAAVAHASQPDEDRPGRGQPAAYRVDVPGGTVTVELDGYQTYLTGPAVLVAHGELTLPDESLPDESLPEET